MCKHVLSHLPTSSYKTQVSKEIFLRNSDERGRNLNSKVLGPKLKCFPFPQIFLQLLKILRSRKAFLEGASTNEKAPILGDTLRTLVSGYIWSRTSDTEMHTHIPCPNEDGDHVRLWLFRMLIFHLLQKLAEAFSLLKMEKQKRNSVMWWGRIVTGWGLGPGWVQDWHMSLPNPFPRNNTSTQGNTDLHP